MLKTRLITLSLAAALLSSNVPSASASGDPLAPLAFLVGTWKAGANTGPQGAGVGQTTFESSLQGRVIVRKNHAEYPATADRPAQKHDDLMVIYAAGDAMEADYYDNEGHKIHYTITSPEEGRLVFLGDLPAAGPRFRLTYVKHDKNVVEGEFDIAAPGKPDDFQKFLSWEMHRATKTARS